jgi:hypothetical protein
MLEMSEMIESKEIRLAMLGMIPGNGHPYSWSAIFNGYDEKEMASCPYPVIPQYLGKEPRETLRIPGAVVTHLWTDNPAEAAHVARASLIPNVAAKPEDVIGHVDAVLVATDDGSDHVRRCRPFVEAGLPIFVDKPLADNEMDLKQFSRWVEQGARILSSSCMRYAKEFMPMRLSTHEVGKVRFIFAGTSNSWERYGIHALEGVYPVLGPGFLSVRNTGASGRDIVHLTHTSGADVVIAAISDMGSAFGAMQVYGTTGRAQALSTDTFFAFKAQLEAYINYLRTGALPFPFSETQELMKAIIAGQLSREQGGRLVLLDEIDC